MMRGKRTGCVALAPRKNGCSEASQSLDTCRCARDTGFSHQAFQAGKLEFVRNAVLQQPVALAHRALEPVGNETKRGVEAQCQAVKERSAVGSWPGKEPVHGRREPNDLHMVGEHA